MQPDAQRKETAEARDAVPGNSLSGTALNGRSGKGAASSAPRVFLVQLDTLTPNQSQTLALAEGLARAGWDARIVCRNDSLLADRARSRGIEAHLLPAEGERGFAMLWRFFRALRGGSKQSTVVHACDAAASLLAATAWRLNKKLRIVHTRRISVMESDFKIMKRYAVPEADIVTDTLAGKVALQLSGLGTQKVHTIPCGIGPDEYPRHAHRDDGRFVHAVMGEMIEGLGHGLLYGALGILQGRTSPMPWEVRFLGNGPAFPQLLEEAKAEGIERYMGFLCEVDEIAELVRCDSLVLPSAEGESHVPLILQGWACDVPVIAVNRLDHTETLVADVNCLLVQPSDVSGMAESLARIVSDADLRRRLVRNGRISLENYTLRAMVDAHIKLYETVLA